MIRFRTVLPLALALIVGVALLATNGFAGKDKRMLGAEALTMSDAELFPDLNKGFQIVTTPAGYKGDLGKGKKVFDNIKKGNCAACHCTAGTIGCGDIGPSLDKYMSELGSDKNEPWIFQQIGDARAHNPDTVMPPSIPTKALTPEEVADVVTYLMSLK